MATIRNLPNLDPAEYVALVDKEQADERHEAARMLCLVGLTQYPRSAKLFTLLGWLQLRSGDLADAESSFRHALCHNRTSADTHAGLAAALAQSGDFSAAETHYSRSLELAPGSARTLFNYGCTQMSLRRLDEAIHSFQEVIRLDPQLTDAHHNLAIAFNKSGRWAEAIESCNDALAIAPGSWQIRLARAMTRLALGSFAEGWTDYEARIESQDYCTQLLGLPEWHGPNDHRSSIAVVPEQGVGTQIMFASCLADLTTHVARVTMACDPRLIPLFRRSFPSVEIVADGLLPLLARNGNFDCYVMVGSLPKFFRRTRGSFSGKQYLVADDGVRNKWATRLDELGPGCKIGVSWRGGSFRRDSLHRCTELADWLPVLELPRVHWVNLQYDAQPAELDAWRQACSGRFDECRDLDKKHDFENMAALVSELNLVISVVNSTVHLAGGLGVPTWTLVPRGGEWRWLAAGETCLWHRSVQLFRQRQHDDWTPEFANLRSQLASRLARSISDAA